MMLKRTEFIARVNIDEETLEIWLSEQWLLPLHEEDHEAFTEADISRAQLIMELQRDFGINQPGIGVALHLLDQLHSATAILKRMGQK
jgi:chaperone modulatory protein CbpM